MKDFLQSSLSYWVMCWTICNSKVHFCFKDWIRYHLQHKVKNIFLMKSIFLKNDWFIHKQTMKLKLKKRNFNWEKNHVHEKVSIFSFSINNNSFSHMLLEFLKCFLVDSVYSFLCFLNSDFDCSWDSLIDQIKLWTCVTITLVKGIIDAF